MDSKCNFFFLPKVSAKVSLHTLYAQYHCKEEMTASKPGFCIVQKSNRNL